MTTTESKGSGSHNTHASESASGADRWATCTASSQYIHSLRVAGEIPWTGETSTYAKDGTIAHDVADAWLRHYILTGEKLPLEAPHEALKSYLDECVELCIEGDENLVEEEVRLWYSKNPDDKGTCDFMSIHGTPMIYSRDLKWGEGDYTVKLRNERNRQLAIYTRSWIEEDMRLWGSDYSLSTPVSMALSKPRVDSSEMPWCIEYGELIEFTRHIEEAKSRIDDDRDLEFKPSASACRWCPAKTKCKARAIAATNVIPVDMVVGALTQDQKVALFKMGDVIRALLKDNAADLASQVEAPEGLKYKPGKTTRKYRDEVEVGEFLIKVIGDEKTYEKKLIAMTKAEKMLTKDQKITFNTLLTKSQAQPTLVADDGETPSIVTLKQQLFDGVL